MCLPGHFRLSIGTPAAAHQYIYGLEGDAFALVSAEATLPLRPPALSLRILGGVGASSLSDARVLPAGWSGSDTGGLRPWLGLGLATGWDILRVDLARGLNDGLWELFFTVSPRLADWL